MFEFKLILLLIWLSLGDCFSNANKFFELFFWGKKRSIACHAVGIRVTRITRVSHYARKDVKCVCRVRGLLQKCRSSHSENGFIKARLHVQFLM